MYTHQPIDAINFTVTSLPRSSRSGEALSRVASIRIVTLPQPVRYGARVEFEDKATEYGGDDLAKMVDEIAEAEGIDPVKLHAKVNDVWTSPQ